MATDPSSIIAGLLQSGANVGQSVGQGFTQGLQDQNDQAAVAMNALKLQGLQQQTANDAAYQADVAGYEKNPTMDGLAHLAIKYPGHADAIKEFWAIKDPEVRQSHITALAQPLAALENGKPDLAIQSLQQVRDAARAKGEPTDDIDSQISALQSGDKDSINTVKAGLMMHLAAADPEGKFAESLAKVQKAYAGGDAYTLDAGQTRFDGNNNVIARGSPKGMEPFHYTLKDGSGQEHEYIYDPSSGQPLPPGVTAAPGASGAAALASDGKLDPVAFYKQFVLPHEGGYAPHDANGAPVNHGINQSANPGVDVKNLSADDAAGIFASKYFPSSANLPPALAAVNADTSFINPKRAAQFLQASGGDPVKYMALRQNWMNSLVQNDPQTYGKYAKAWGTRNADLSAYAQNLSGGSASGAAPVSGGMPTRQIGGSRQIDNTPVNNSPPGDVSLIPDNLSGPQALSYLQQKNPGVGNRIAGIMAGQIPYPSATRKDTQPLLNAISQIDPTFDASKWKARNETAAQYAAGGAVGKVLTSGATSIGHLYDLAQAAQKLPDHYFGWVNSLANNSAPVGSDAGRNLSTFDRSRTLYAPEVSKYLAGTGAAAEGETNKHYASFDPSLGKTGILDNLATDTKYIADKFDQQAQAYQQTMGKPLVIDGQGQTGGPATAKMAALRFWSDNQDKPLPVVVMAPAQAAKLPSGTIFVTPDGQVRTKH